MIQQRYQGGCKLNYKNKPKAGISWRVSQYEILGLDHRVHTFRGLHGILMLGKLTIALLMIGVCWNASAQTGSWDSSGNGLLSGTYYFRHVLWGDTAGEVGRALSAYGTITFTPASGTYMMNAQTFDSVRRGSSPPS